MEKPNPKSNTAGSSSWMPGTASSKNSGAAVPVAWPLNHHLDSNNNTNTCTNQETRDIAELAKTIGNEFRGEFIVLPHHLVNFDHGDPVDLGPDDEVSSNSEDCIYAYRGDQVDGQELNPIAVDGDPGEDETDFLEMDFDEPNSEQEINPYRRSGEEEFPRVPPTEGLPLLDRRQVEVVVVEPLPGCSTRDSVKPQELPLVDQEEPDKRQSPTNEENKTGDENLSNDDCDQIDENDSDDKNIELIASLDDYEDYESICSDNDEAEDDSEGDDNISIPVTGTTPKVTTQELQELQSSPVHNTTNTIPLVPVPSTSNTSSDHPLNNSSTSFTTTIITQGEGDVSCLECSEMELLQLSSASSHCKKHCKKLRNTEPTEIHGKDKYTKQIQICPNILLDEENIYTSFLQLGIELHRDRLHSELESNRLSLERTKTIAGYLIKYTKANCDPRRFVRLIEKSCPEEVFCELDFNFQSVAPEFNVLSVSTGELLSRWSSEEGLQELSRVNNKRFSRANVLGRVANLLRLRGSSCSGGIGVGGFSGSKQKCREIDKVSHATISVPTYYRPGFLMISLRDTHTHNQQHQTTNATLL